MEKIYRNLAKLLIISSIIVLIIISGVFFSLSILKDEAIKSNLKIAKLHANTFSEQLTQTLVNIEFVMDNLELDNNLNKKIKIILKSNPYIRSINIIEKNTISYSSNKLNLGLKLKLDEYYPLPLFKKSILRIGTSLKGRDLYSSFDNKITKKESVFLPIIKEYKKFTILITLNSDYFINRYLDDLESNLAYIDILRVDGKLLFSSENKDKSSDKYSKNKLFTESLNKSLSSGISKLNNKSYIQAYQLTDFYPLNISVRLDYENSLKGWENKRQNFLLLVSSLILFFAVLILILLFHYSKEKEKELKLQKKFKLLFEQSIFAAAVIKQNGIISDVNHLTIEFLGRRYQELVGLRFWDLYCWSEEDKLWLKNTLNNFKLGDTIERDFKCVNNKGKTKIIHFILTSLQDEGSYELVALGLDITEKKEKENQLKHAYIVFENTHDGILVTDNKANIINVNKAFENSTGFKLEEIKGKNPKFLQSGKHNIKFYSQMWKELQKKGFWEGELINRNKEGKIYNERLTINTVFDEEKRIKNFIGVFYDTTKQKQQDRIIKEKEELLYQQSKMAAMGEMLENIAHQWRQPLSVISTLSTGIKLQKEMNILSEEEEIKELDAINESAQYLSKTIDDFRSFFKVGGEKEEFDISLVIEKTSNLLSSKFKNRDIKFIKNLNNIQVYSSQNELIQVLMNILANAIDALEKKSLEKRVIILNVFEKDEKVFINIKDNGGGIKEDILKRVFEPYFTTKHQSKGTGIGLYMSEEIIVKHLNGLLYVKNTTFTYEEIEYCGACFSIELPIK